MGRVTSQGVDLAQAECEHLHHQQQGNRRIVVANLCTSVDAYYRYSVKTDLRYLSRESRGLPLVSKSECVVRASAGRDVSAMQSRKLELITE